MIVVNGVSIWGLHFLCIQPHVNVTQCDITSELFGCHCWHAAPTVVQFSRAGRLVVGAVGMASSFSDWTPAVLHKYTYILFLWAEKQAYKRMQCRSPIRNEPDYHAFTDQRDLGYASSIDVQFIILSPVCYVTVIRDHVLPKVRLFKQSPQLWFQWKYKKCTTIFTISLQLTAYSHSLHATISLVPFACDR